MIKFFTLIGDEWLVTYYSNILFSVFQDLGKYGLLFYNSLFMFIPVLALSIYTGEIEKVCRIFIYTLDIIKCNKIDHGLNYECYITDNEYGVRGQKVVIIMDLMNTSMCHKTSHHILYPQNKQAEQGKWVFSTNSLII
jgi:hypothetical protein